MLKKILKVSCVLSVVALSISTSFADDCNNKPWFSCDIKKNGPYDGMAGIQAISMVRAEKDSIHILGYDNPQTSVGEQKGIAVYVRLSITDPTQYKNCLKMALLVSQDPTKQFQFYGHTVAATDNATIVDSNKIGACAVRIN